MKTMLNQGNQLNLPLGIEEISAKFDVRQVNIGVWGFSENSRLRMGRGFIR